MSREIFRSLGFRTGKRLVNRKVRRITFVIERAPRFPIEIVMLHAREQCAEFTTHRRHYALLPLFPFFSIRLHRRPEPRRRAKNVLANVSSPRVTMTVE